MDKNGEQLDKAFTFYKTALELLARNNINFMIGGGIALYHYTKICRDTKDLDIFCKSCDCPKIMKLFAEEGYRTELHDVRWIAKIFYDEHYIDVIYDTVNNICSVDDSWFEHAEEADFLGMPVKFVPAEELVWCKSYVQNRERFDGADINHLFLKYGKRLDWTRVLSRLDRHWHLLLAHIIMFQFVYPSEYQDIIPRWLFDELMSRAQQQYELPGATERVCRGPIVDNTQYSVDIKEWNYKSYTIKTV